MTIPFQDFIPFMGVVQAYKDNAMSGRCKVRCFGIHPPSHDPNVPVELLPWSMVCNSSVGGVHSPDPKPGEWVFGFFLDGRDAQFPIIMGSIPSMNIGNLNNPWADNSTETLHSAIKMASPSSHHGMDVESHPLITSAAARVENLVSAGGYDVTEPSIQLVGSGATSINSSEFNGAQVIASKEHCTMTFGGSVVQIHPDGSVHIHSSSDLWNVSEGGTHDVSQSNRDVIINGGDYNIKVNGSCNIYVNGNMTQTVTGDYSIGVGGAFSVVSGEMAFVKGATVSIQSSSGDVGILAEENMNIAAGDDINIKATTGGMSLDVTKSFNVKAAEDLILQSNKMDLRSAEDISMDSGAIIDMQNGKAAAAITTAPQVNVPDIDPPARSVGQLSKGGKTTGGGTSGHGLNTSVDEGNNETVMA